jgi:trans-AT polyketide synthase/acyltransferase/oxidoreductase domain-containing protein
MVTYAFPGQGSQAKGMGSGLFEEYSDLIRKADKILGYSIKSLCLEDPDNLLGQTDYTQPALFIINSLSFLKKIKSTNILPDYVIGHSLGEYSALFAAGAFDFETGLKLVQKRGKIMAGAKGGGMAAIIGLTEDAVKKTLKDNNLGSIDIANLNSPFQIVISGPKADIGSAENVFIAAGAKYYMPLKVSGAFHSRYMDQSKKEFLAFLEQFQFNQLKIPVISNVTARPYDFAGIKNLLAEQITSSVKWTESICYLMGKGVTEFEEIGPGKTLTGMIQKIKNEAKPLIIEEKNTGSDQSESSQASRDSNSPTKSAGTGKITAETIGNTQFKKDYNLKYAYIAGSMFRGISSPELVVTMGKAGMMGFFGTGGLSLSDIENAIRQIRKELSNGESFGMNLLYQLTRPELEEKTVDLFIKHNVRFVEASAYMTISPALVRYKLMGLTKDAKGNVSSNNKIMAKLSRPEVAEEFLSPAPQSIVQKLLASNSVTREQAELSGRIAMADDICVEADSGGHTDGGNAYTLMPAITKLNSEMKRKYGYRNDIRIGAAGGIGTPEAAAAAIILGADFIVTGSINQCTREAANSDSVKDMLQQINVQDTEYAPSADMFELGAKVQVLKKGVFFPARANKLFELYKQHNCIEDIDEKTKTQIQDKFFKRNFNDIFNEIKEKYPHETVKADANPKHKMALIFRWYFRQSINAAMSGNEELRLDYQVHCGPALGAFNQWVKGTELENWRNRFVDKIGSKILHETAELLDRRFRELTGMQRS